VLSAAGHYLRVLRPAAAAPTDSNEGGNEVDGEDAQADEEDSDGSDRSGSDLDASAENFDSSESVDDLALDGGYGDLDGEDEAGEDYVDGDDVSIRDDEGGDGEYEEATGSSEGREEEDNALLMSGAESREGGREVGMEAAPAGRRGTPAAAGGSAPGARVEMFW
jgi:hypothetical protein